MSHSIRHSTGMNGRQVCNRLSLPYSTWLRWQRRARNGQPLLAAPGPKKLGPLPFDKLREEVEQLRHGRHRSRGTTRLTSNTKPRSRAVSWPAWSAGSAKSAKINDAGLGRGSRGRNPTLHGALTPPNMEGTSRAGNSSLSPPRTSLPAIALNRWLLSTLLVMR